MLTTQKYSDEFLKIYDTENNKGQIIKDIIEIEGKTKTNLLEWRDDEEVVKFLKKAGAVSPQSLNKRMVVLRKFADFICKKEKIAKREYITEDGTFMRLLDREQLNSVTLNYDQYVHIKNQLNMVEDGEKINIRDKVIFELAWASLTNDEIRSIKEENIEFVQTDNDWEIAIINLEGKTIRIEDPEVARDIKLCLKETYCVRSAKDGRTKKTFYKDSKYLIKPINVGRTSNKTYLDNPHLALQRVLRSGEITCEGIDVASLTLSDIRRSRLIYLLAPENEEYFNFATVAALYGMKTPEALRWYKGIAVEKYGEKQ